MKHFASHRASCILRASVRPAGGAPGLVPCAPEKARASVRLAGGALEQVRCEPEDARAIIYAHGTTAAYKEGKVVPSLHSTAPQS